MSDNWLMFFVGFTAGCWLAFFMFIKFLAWNEERRARTGFVELNGTIYRLEKLKAGE